MNGTHKEYSQNLIQAALLAFVLLFLGLTGCAGGSVGTDNPTFAVVTKDGSQASVADTVTVRVWYKNQNPILSPKPIWDTVISSAKPFILKSKQWGLADTSWNIEAFSKNGSMDLVSDVREDSKGNLVRNGVLLPDTLLFDLKSRGSVLLYTYTVVSTGVSVIKQDTLVIDSTSKLTAPSNTYVGTTAAAPAYLVILGSSIIIPFTGHDHPDGSHFDLPAGTYTMQTMDAKGTLLDQWQVTVTP